MRMRLMEAVVWAWNWRASRGVFCMQKHNIDPGQTDGPDSVSQKRAWKNHNHAGISLVHIIAGLLALLVLSISFSSFVAGVKASYAQTTITILAADTSTPTPTDTPTPTPTSTSTPTPTPTTPPPTPTAMPTATATPKPTVAPRPSPTATPIVAVSPSATASVSPTATSTVVLGGGGGGSTPGTVPTQGPTTPSGNGGGQAGGGFPLSTVLLAVFTLFGLVLSIGVGWLLFRRMLMPTTETKLKPSGARPWSRTRVANAENVAGQMNMSAMNAAPGFGVVNNGYPQQQASEQNMHNGYSQQQASEQNMHNGYAQQQAFEQNMHNGYPQQQGFNPTMNNGYPQQGMNGYGQTSGGFNTPASGFNSFSDSFVPPSPYSFPQGDTSMIPPNTNALALGHNTGYAPNSNAFNAMYGLPDDPFAASQGGGGPGWLDNLGGGQQKPVPNNFISDKPNINDPYLAEVIRQYSQKSQAVHPPQAPLPEQQRPNFPNPNSDWAR
jgi:hypothetical protein